MAGDPARHVLIVGGGASGTLLAVHLLRSAGARVTLVEKRGDLGRGFAYGEAQPMHLLNVRAANVSAYPDAPDHFVEWLDRNAIREGVTGEGRFRFVPRLTYGRYLAEQLDDAAAIPSNRGRFKCIKAEAIAIARHPEGIVLMLSGGAELVGDVAVIATGYEAPQPSSLPLALPAWKPIDLAAIENVDNVLILGTGHSAIDHIQSLLAAGYRGSFTAISRRGLLPAMHRPFEADAIDRADLPLGGAMSAVWGWFRARSEAAERRGSDWRAVLDGLRPHVQAIWLRLAPDERRRFLRHARAWWEVRRHRMAPSVAMTLDGLRDSGRLRVIAAKIISVEDTAPTVEVVYRRRGAAESEVLHAGAIIDCTGFSLDVASFGSPVVHKLIAGGLARPDPLGLGFEVDASCALIATSNEPAVDLFAIGPLTRGAFWETVGIPDIRAQCVLLAERLSSAGRQSVVPQEIIRTM
jgi:uncharacterized NAD(P)/FAD-binding protein YdhS